MSIPSWAKPGVKVVCVNSDWKKGRLPLFQWLIVKFLGLPISGGIYTITGSMPHRAGGCAITLKGWGDSGFHSEFFRPLVSNKRTEAEDVGLFTHHLDTSKVSA